MVEALESISRPGPSGRHNIQVAPEDLQTPRAELPRQLGAPAEEETPRRRKAESPSEGSRSASQLGSELSMVDSRGGETTEDEMDDDAVLLKRPKEE